MLLILINWLIIIYVAFMHGYWLRRLFAFQTQDSQQLSLTVVWGLCAIFVWASLILFFTSLGFVVFLVFALSAGVIHVIFMGEIRQIVSQFYQGCLTFRNRLLLLTLIGALLIFSAQPSKIVDDGLYYTQTVMWLCDSGFVKGISNLLLPLGLTSSWHVIQAVFSLSFIGGIRFNDLNGFLVVIFLLYFIERATKREVLSQVLLSLGILLSVPFLSACSPDLPVLLLSIIGFDLLYRDNYDGVIYDLLLLAVFGFSIKLSSIALVLFPISYLILHSNVWRKEDSRLVAMAVLGVCVVIVVVAKNIYLTGYPIYPFHYLGFESLEWTTPIKLVDYYETGLQASAFTDIASLRDLGEMKKVTVFESFFNLIGRGGYKGMLNIILFVTLAISSLMMVAGYILGSRSPRSFSPILIIQGICLINIAIWLLFAPQYRFILPVFVFEIGYILLVIDFSSKLDLSRVFNLMPGVSIFIISISGFLSLTSLIGSFESNYVVSPWFSDKPAELDTMVINGTRYYHRRGLNCGDSPLPCMSRSYSDFLKRAGGYSIRTLGFEYSVGFALDRKGDLR